MYNNGGELIYHGIPVFIDGRADLYSGKNLQEYFDVVDLDGNFLETMEKYDFDYYLISKECYLNSFLMLSGSAEIIYENDTLVLYKKTVND